ncbi:hypothetical protein HYU13_01720 [Candidatus Woesearchaeota archaeon]|nr:hypothetical protein [Candidatus Woesearchaeota archaeon]
MFSYEYGDWTMAYCFKKRFGEKRVAKKKRGKSVTSKVQKHIGRAHKQVKKAIRHIAKVPKKALKHFAGRKPSRKSKVSKVRKLIRLALQRRRK